MKTSCYTNGKYHSKCYRSQLSSYKYPYQLGNFILPSFSFWDHDVNSALSKTCLKNLNMRRSKLQRQLWGYIYVFNFLKPEHTTTFRKNMIIALKIVVFHVLESSPPSVVLGHWHPAFKAPRIKSKGIFEQPRKCRFWKWPYF